MPGKIAAHGDFRAVNAIDARIAAGAAAKDFHHQAGNETEVHQMFGHRWGQFQLRYDGAFADVQVGQSAPAFAE